MSPEERELEALEAAARGEEEGAPLDPREVELLKTMMDLPREDGRTAATKVMLALGRRERQRRWRQGLLAAVALALLGVLLPSWVASLSLDRQKHQGLEDSMAWLSQQQLEDGSWDVVAWGGKSKFKEGVISLALLPFIERGAEGDEEIVVRGCRHLLEQVNSDGTVGEPFIGDLYNHALASLALSRAAQKGWIEVDLSPLRQRLLKYQGEDGSFAYRPGHPTEWVLGAWAYRALSHLPGQGEVGVARRAFEDWVHRQAGGLSSQGDLVLSSWVGQAPPLPTNLHERFRSDHALETWFLSTLVDDSQGFKLHAKSLLEHQVKGGEMAGSWEEDPYWGHVGGRLYSTSLGAMALQAI